MTSRKTKAATLWRAAAGAAVLALGMTASLQAAAAFKVGIMMPTQNESRWDNEGKKLRDTLLSQGLEPDLFFGGDDDIPIQQRQIPRLVKEGKNAIVIAPIDGDSLSDQLEEAKSKGVPVISYDRLIMNSGAVTYYATFDNKKAGVIQGQAIERALDLPNCSPDDPKTIEFFAGSERDNNSKYFWNGMMEVLQPYLDSGVLICPSGQVTLHDCAIDKWSTDLALKRMDDLLAKQGYKSSGTGMKHLDAVYSSADCLSTGILTSLEKHGYKAGSMPVITGQDANADILRKILAGEVTMTVFKDSDVLVDRVAKMVASMAKGEEVEINDTTSYDNGAGPVKTYQCDPIEINKDNLKKLLLDTGKRQI
jgi:putative multiple sugar transport system substrate-binding protein